MTLKDIDQVYELGLHTKELQISPTEDMFYSKDNLIRAINSLTHICLVIRVNGEFAGFRFAQIDEALGDTYLSDIVIKPEYRGLGLGNHLFEESLKIVKSKGYNWVWALVQEDNSLMQNFLDKKGFIKGRKFFMYFKEM